ncbi:MAG: CBS domain-containing protein, partial [Planctomycetota bacterium]
MSDTTATCHRAIAPAPEMRPLPSLEFDDAELKIEDLMSETIVSAGPDETILSAARRMSKRNISCIVVTMAEGAVGILTERDVLRGVATGYDNFLTRTVAEKMSSPVIAVPPDLSALEASELMESKGIKRLLVARGHRPIGVVTQTDITRGLISMSPFKNIADLMTTDVVTVNATTTITEAAQLMASHNISCVVLMHRGEAAGIVTEKDVLQRVVACNEDPTTTPAAEIMSFPVATIPPTYSVMSATRMMYAKHIHRLVVGNAGEVQGIVTQTDIIAAVRRKVEEARAARVRRQSERGQLSDAAMRTLASIQGLVTEARTPAGGNGEATQVA